MHVKHTLMFNGLFHLREYLSSTLRFPVLATTRSTVGLSVSPGGALLVLSSLHYFVTVSTSSVRSGQSCM